MTFTAAGRPAEAMFQWYRLDGAGQHPVGDGQSPVLDISPIQVGDYGLYFYEVSDALNNVARSLNGALLSPILPASGTLLTNMAGIITLPPGYGVPGAGGSYSACRQRSAFTYSTRWTYAKAGTPLGWFTPVGSATTATACLTVTQPAHYILRWYNANGTMGGNTFNCSDAGGNCVTINLAGMTSTQFRFMAYYIGPAPAPAQSPELVLTNLQ